jgi:NDP-sugar pyrophosphorylase family protein
MKVVLFCGGLGTRIREYSESIPKPRDGGELVIEPFNRLVEGGHLMAYKHEGFWRAMDTLRDRQVLEEMVERGDMPWRVCARMSRS